jgi:hypothetical protein
MPPAVIGAKPLSVIPRGLPRGGFIHQAVGGAVNPKADRPRSIPRFCPRRRRSGSAMFAPTIQNRVDGNLCHAYAGERYSRPELCDFGASQAPAVSSHIAPPAPWSRSASWRGCDTKPRTVTRIYGRGEPDAKETEDLRPYLLPFLSRTAASLITPSSGHCSQRRC